MFGLLNLNKPAGCTSRDLVTRVTRLVGRQHKVGHAGTLDPLATGVLVVCVGTATRLVPLIHDHLKSYEAEFLLGQQSETDDLEGTLQSVPIPPGLSLAQIESALPEFLGKIQQVPPAYSAVKIDGKRAYKAARSGETFDLTPREVTVTRLEVRNLELPKLQLSIDCGTGTYIRSIGRDLARRLGTEAVMSSLVRTRIGSLGIETALDIEDLPRDRLRESLISPLVMLDHLRSITVNEEQARLLICGQFLDWPAGLSPARELGERFTVLTGQGDLMAIAAEHNGKIAPRIVVRTNVAA